jgi:hypothetical protein
MPHSVTRILNRAVLLLAASSVCLLAAGTVVHAQAPPPENPQSGSVGLEGIMPTDPPSEGATIVIPNNGQVFTDIPIRISGLCPDNLLVRLFSNEVFIGSVMCEDGSYELEAGIFGGQNDLVARVYDALDQPGPDSNTVSVTLNDAQFNPLGLTPMTLTSDFARRGADPGDPLSWPFILSGGRGPYAVSVDPGDGSSPILMSLDAPGVFDVEHAYQAAGIYRITVRVTDADGQNAYLQVVAVANGNPARADQVGGTLVLVRIIWWPALLSVLFIFIAFWLGRRYQVQVLRKNLERHRG